MDNGTKQYYVCGPNDKQKGRACSSSVHKRDLIAILVATPEINIPAQKRGATVDIDENTAIARLIGYKYIQPAESGMLKTDEIFRALKWYQTGITVPELCDIIGKHFS